MGLRFLRGGSRDSAFKTFEKQFGAYFPRAFAYAFANLGDEAAARDVVGGAFSGVFADGTSGSDEDFRIALFVALREECRVRKRAVPLDVGIASSERDVLTLAFDGGLSMDEVNRVLASDRAVDTLTSALRKMRALSRPGIPAFFRVP
jgi:hypothetical protein